MPDIPAGTAPLPFPAAERRRGNPGREQAADLPQPDRPRAALVPRPHPHRGLGRDRGISRATAYRYVAHAAGVLSQQAPDLPQGPGAGDGRRSPYVVLDGRVFASEEELQKNERNGQPRKPPTTSRSSFKPPESRHKPEKLRAVTWNWRVYRKVHSIMSHVIVLVVGQAEAGNVLFRPGCTCQEIC